MNGIVKDQRFQKILNKVPEITIFFWIIKVLATTMGETASDFLNVNLNFGLVGTSIVTGIILAVVLFFQIRAKKYVPALYWSTIVLISIFGTLVTDNMTDGMNIPLEFSTIMFSILLAITFAVWYAKEKTLSIHSIFTRQREAFYWLTILFTFALGTAAGDLMAEALGLGYAVTGIIIVILVLIFSIGWKKGLNSVLAFWLIYIMTRPLGASLGDLLTQPAKYGGLGLGATNTSIIFMVAILGTVAYLTVTKKDAITDTAILEDEKEERYAHQHHAAWQVAAVMTILIIAAGTGYYFRRSQLQAQAKNTAEQVAQQDVSSSSVSLTVATNSAIVQTPQVVSPLGDMSDFITITQDTLNLVNSGNLSGATARVADLEHDWDAAEGKLKSKDNAKWTEVDNAIDKVLRQLRAVKPDAGGCKSSLEDLLTVLK